MPQISDTKPLPKYLKVSDQGVLIALKYPAQANGVAVDSLTLRAPTVKDSREAKAQSGGDVEKQEMLLFCSLAQVGLTDIESLSLLDYARLQEGYFRLVSEDEL